MHPHIYCNFVCNSKIREQPKCPLRDEWIKNITHTHTQIMTQLLKKRERERNLAAVRSKVVTVSIASKKIQTQDS